jgi:hypothetical protein
MTVLSVTVIHIIGLNGLSCLQRLPCRDKMFTHVGKRANIYPKAGYPSILAASTALRKLPLAM